MEATPGMRYVGRWTVSAVLPVDISLYSSKTPRVCGITFSVCGSVSLLAFTFLAVLTAYILAVDIVTNAAGSGARLKY